LDHLKKEETIYAVRIINKYSDLFRLPEELLGHIDVNAHKILTTDDRSINTKQYRCPPFHKDKVNKQMKDLMMKRNQSSNSPYNSHGGCPKEPESNKR